MAVPGKRAEKSFSASTSLASDEDLKVYCIPCDRTGPRLPAFGFCQDCNEHLCETCFCHHKKATLSMHHILLDKGAMPKTIRLESTSSHISKSDDLTKPCLKHKKKVIEFYCQNHRILLCSVCVTLEHTGKSCHVDYIPDISGKVVDSKEFKHILEHLDAIIRHCHEVKEECKKVTQTSNNSLTEVLKEIKKYRQEINKRIDELENAVEKEAKSLQEQNDERLQATDNICDDVTISMKAISDNIKQSNMTKQADKLFIELKTAEIEMKQHEDCMNELTIAEDVKAFHYKSNQAILNVLQNEKCLGTLEQKILSTPKLKLDKHALKPQTVPKIPRKLHSVENKITEFSRQYEICVKTTNDKETCWITGMTLPNKDQLVVVDRSNRSVKLIAVKRKAITSEITLSSAPMHITSVSSNQFAVTMLGAHTIQFLSAASNKVSLTHRMKVGGACYGICHYKNKLVVSYESPAKLEILDMKGTVLITVTTNENGENIFKHPEYIQLNSHSIYVSDSENKTVTMLNWEGKVTRRYRDVEYAQGLALSADGTVFVCDWSKKNIVEISGDCRQGRVVIKDVSSPRAMCWCDEDHTLYISSRTLTESDNVISVFNKL